LEYLDEYTSREETRLEVLGSRMLKRVTGAKQEELTGGWNN
jgi:hypothetical protein